MFKAHWRPTEVKVWIDKTDTEVQLIVTNQRGRQVTQALYCGGRR